MYNSIKSEYFDSLINIIGETEQASIQAFKSTIFKPEFEEGEERIECLCGQYKDEGLMIQCEKVYTSPLILEIRLFVRAPRLTYKNEAS